MLFNLQVPPSSKRISWHTGKHLKLTFDILPLANFYSLHYRHFLCFIFWVFKFHWFRASRYPIKLFFGKFCNNGRTRLFFDCCNYPILKGFKEKVHFFLLKRFTRESTTWYFSKMMAAQTNAKSWRKRFIVENRVMKLFFKLNFENFRTE